MGETTIVLEPFRIIPNRQIGHTLTLISMFSKNYQCVMMWSEFPHQPSLIHILFHGTFISSVEEYWTRIAATF